MDTTTTSQPTIDAKVLRACQLKLISNDPLIAVTQDGINRWGVYFEIVRYRLDHTVDEMTECEYKGVIRVFIADSTICTYILEDGQLKTVWRRRKMATPEAALHEALKVTSCASGEIRLIRGAPLLVQLTHADVKLLESDMLPSARYRGNYLYTKNWGKADDEEAFDYKLLNMSFKTDGVEALLKALQEVAGHAPLWSTAAVAASTTAADGDPEPSIPF